jgi:hypothetical protein
LQLFCIHGGVRMIGIQISVARERHVRQIIRCYSANIVFHIPLACQFVRTAWRYLATKWHAYVRFNLVCIPKSTFIPACAITIFGYRFPLLYYLSTIDLPSIIQMDSHKYMYIHSVDCHVQNNSVIVISGPLRAAIRDN